MFLDAPVMATPERLDRSNQQLARMAVLAGLDVVEVLPPPACRPPMSASTPVR